MVTKTARRPHGVARADPALERGAVGPTPKRVVLFLLFVASGFCGLLYQVVWIRLAFAAFGVITPVLSVVISVFMLGLALGCLLYTSPSPRDS